MTDEAIDATGSDPPPPVVAGEPVEIAAGIWVIPDGGVPLVPNVGIVEGSRSVLVVDTGMSLRSGAAVARHAQAIARGKPIMLTITHFHPEHGYGAQALAPLATVAYNRAQLAELHDKGRSYAELFRGFGDAVAAELDGLEFVAPDLVYDRDADLDLGSRVVQLRSAGGAHTRGDQVIFLPAERVLFTGDLVENGAFPIFPYFPPDDVDVDGERWIELLEQLARLEPRIVVPGHGAVGDRELITDVRDYLVELRDETSRLTDGGTGVDEIAARLEAEMVRRHPSWSEPEWIGFAVRSFHAAATTERP